MFNKSRKELTSGKPHNFLTTVYGGMPTSRPLWISTDNKSSLPLRCVWNIKFDIYNMLKSKWCNKKIFVNKLNVWNTI